MAALTTIRLVGRVVAVLAGAAAVTYVVSALTGPQILWLVGGPLHTGGEFVELPLALRLAHAAAAVLVAGTVAGSSGLVYGDDVSDPLSFAQLESLPIDWSFGTWSLVPDLPLLGLAVVIGVLAHIIGAGERLQRDTEGLV